MTIPAPFRIPLMAAVVVAIAIACYASALHAPFAFDDTRDIVENVNIRSFRPIFHPSEAVKISGATYKGGSEFFKLFLTRIVGFASFAADYGIHGLDPAGFRATNIAIHATAGLLVLALVLALFESPFLHGRPGVTPEAARFVGFVAAALFVAHPVQTQAVTYIDQRFASLATLLYLAALVAYCRGRLHILRGGSARGAILWHSLSFATALLGAFTKEISVTLPLMAVVTEVLFFTGTARSRIAALAPLFLAAAAIPATHALYDGGLVAGLSRASRGASTPRLVYLANQPASIALYLRLIVWPAGQNLDHANTAFQSLLEPAALPYVGLVAFMLVAAVAMIRRSLAASPLWRLAGYGIVWFFIALATESSVIPIVEYANEHRIYLASPGVFIAAALALATPFTLSRSRTAALVLCTAVVVALSTATVLRNRVWQSDEALWSDVVAKNPRSARGLVNLANAFRGRDDMRAYELYRRSVAIEPSIAAIFNIASIAWGNGRDDEALQLYERVLSMNDELSIPSVAYARLNMGHIQFKRGRYDLAYGQYEQASRSVYCAAEASYNLGITAERLGRRDAAIAAYERFLAMVPTAYGQLVPSVRAKLDALRRR